MSAELSDELSTATRGTKGPVFIVGPMGSGTTLMRLILDSHDNIAIAQETSIMRAYLAHKWVPFHRHGGDWYGRLGWSEGELDDRLREFYGGMFARFAAEQGKQRWGEKTPWHVWHLGEIAALFPDAVFIAMVRHPGAVTTSVSGRFRQSWGGAATHWVNSTTEEVQKGIALGVRLLMVRYEDLVTEPEVTLREVFDWLDEPWSDRLLEHDKVHSERGTAAQVEGATRSDKPIATDRIAAWAEGKSDYQFRVLAERAERLAPFYGYVVDNAEALHPMTAPGAKRRKTLTGTELARRSAQFPELADLLTKVIVPWAGNRLLTQQAFGLVAVKPPPPPPKPKPVPETPSGLVDHAYRLARRVLRGVRRRVSSPPTSPPAADMPAAAKPQR